MTSQLTEFFVHPVHKKDKKTHRQFKLLVRASLLTSFFSAFYIWVSIFISFPIGIWLMIFNVVGFLILTFLCKTPLPFRLLGNLYVFIGAVAVLAIPYYSGGIYSPNYPWIISIPILATLIVNRKSGLIWGVFSLIYMLYLGLLELQGTELPILYDTSVKSYYLIANMTGLLLITLVISYVFSTTQQTALVKLEASYQKLSSQKDTIMQQSESMEKLIDDKDQFIRMLAHDLKNPLTNIRNISQMMETKNPAKNELNYYEMFSEVSGKGLQLIDNVLKMVLLEEGGIQLKQENIAIEEAIKSSIIALKPLAVNKEININILAKETDIKVKADRMYLEQIFDNLISNALKYSPKRTSIDITIEKDDDSVIVKIMDEGPGIPSEDVPNLFEKFSKLSNLPTDNEFSSGLGLSLVKEYVKQIKGSIYYETTPQVGAIFVVVLPVK